MVTVHQSYDLVTVERIDNLVYQVSQKSIQR